LTLAILFTPLQCWLENRLKKSNLAGLVAVLLISFIVIVPLSFVAQQLVLQAINNAQFIENLMTSGEWKHTLDKHQQLAMVVTKIGQHIDLSGSVKSISSWVATSAGMFLRASLFQTLELCLTFYMLFFFLRDRHIALKSLMLLSPLTIHEMASIYVKVKDTVHAIVYGTFAIAAVQGTLGGLMFWWLGLPASLLWGTIMALMSVIPMLGAFVVWAPAVIFLALQGKWLDASILGLWGTLIIATVDNMLRPIWVGQRLKLHTVLSFISVLGGITVFGGIGLVLGPVILTVTIALIEIWLRRSEVDLKV
jgi:predicted PurR-regulated permease PerM